MNNTMQDTNQPKPQPAPQSQPAPEELVWLFGHFADHVRRGGRLSVERPEKKS
jgi:hypothetical protein